MTRSSEAIRRAEVTSRADGDSGPVMRPPTRAASKLPAIAALWLGWVWCDAGAANAASAPAAAVTTARPATHCAASERVQFSCAVGRKRVSLCAAGEPGQWAALALRYGRLGHLEKSFTARPDNALRFAATASPLRPGASVRQLWIDRGSVRYLLTECVGGNCGSNGGLAMLQGDRVLMNLQCKTAAGKDQAGFAPDLVLFGASAHDTHSTSELLQIEDSDNDLHKLFPRKMGPAR